MITLDARLFALLTDLFDTDPAHDGAKTLLTALLADTGKTRRRTRVITLDTSAGACVEITIPFPDQFGFTSNTVLHYDSRESYFWLSMGDSDQVVPGGISDIEFANNGKIAKEVLFPFIQTTEWDSDQTIVHFQE